jgi:hypothetical protein
VLVKVVHVLVEGRARLLPGEQTEMLHPVVHGMHQLEVVGLRGRGRR